MIIRGRGLVMDEYSVMGDAMSFGNISREEGWKLIPTLNDPR